MPSPSELGRRRERLAAARLYLICGARPGGRPLQDVLAAALAGGVDIVQLREKNLDDDELTDIARRAAALCRRRGALFLVNDRPAVARAAGADGVHVGQDDMPVATVRELVGRELLVGLSTHTAVEIDAACRHAATTALGAARTGPAADLAATGDNPPGVDYIGVGPVHATPTKPGRPATGLALVRHAATHATLPFFAIGGIHAENAPAAIAAGARRVAIVRAIAEAADPAHAARELRALLAAAEPGACAPGGRA
jgi:thiamine-phosphate pyrophosphorylase